MTNSIYQAAAVLLIEENGSTTTLEVKNYLREVLPTLYCDQKTVSDQLKFLEFQGVLSYVDNGTHRIYTMAAKNTLVNKLEMGSIIINNKGKEVYVEFKTKENNTLRKMTCIIESIDIFGKATVLENKEHRSFYIDRVKFLQIGNQSWKRK